MKKIDLILFLIQFVLLFLIFIGILTITLAVKDHRKVRKIGYCILLKDEFPTDAVWEKFFQGIPKNRYKIAIHSKVDLSEIVDPELEIINNAVVVPRIQTKWGDYSIVKAQVNTLRECLKDSQVDRFCFISGNCIPIKSFDNSIKFLEKNNKSIFSQFNMTVRFPRFEELINHGVDKDDVGFHHQWCVLRRSHAQLIVDKYDEYIEWFKDIHAPDESTMLTVIQHYKCPKNEIRQISCLKKKDGEDGLQGTTFTHWHDINYRYRMDKLDKLSVSSPKLYEYISYQELMFIAIKAPCIFARKFTKNTKVVLWDNTQISIIEALQKEKII
jgi:hypothetical protein